MSVGSHVDQCFPRVKKIDQLPWEKSRHFSGVYVVLVLPFDKLTHTEHWQLGLPVFLCRKNRWYFPPKKRRHFRRKSGQLFLKEMYVVLVCPLNKFPRSERWQSCLPAFSSSQKRDHLPWEKSQHFSGVYVDLCSAPFSNGNVDDFFGGKYRPFFLH